MYQYTVLLHLYVAVHSVMGQRWGGGMIVMGINSDFTINWNCLVHMVQLLMITVNWLGNVFKWKINMALIEQHTIL